MLFQAKTVHKETRLSDLVLGWPDADKPLAEGVLVVIHLTPDDIGKLVAEKFVRDASNSIYSIFSKGIQSAGGGWTKI